MTLDIREFHTHFIAIQDVPDHAAWKKYFVDAIDKELSYATKARSSAIDTWEVSHNSNTSYYDPYSAIDYDDFTKKVVFLFGSEASGLSNNEVSYANYTLQIPTNPEFKSLNLSHSVIIIAHTVANIIKLKTSSLENSPSGFSIDVCEKTKKLKVITQDKPKSVSKRANQELESLI